MTGEKRQPPGYAFASADYDIFQVIYVTTGRLFFQDVGREVALTAHQALLLGPFELPRTRL